VPGRSAFLAHYPHLLRSYPETLLEKLKFAKDHAGNIERMAVLSDRVWIKSWLKVGGLLTHTEVEHFDRSEMEAAWEWVRQ